jgi:hypothetical protein
VSRCRPAGDKYHLEFTSHDDGSPGRAPTKENLLVFYFASADQMLDVVTRLGESGHQPVELDNPWWRDNWRIVLMPNPIPWRHESGDAPKHLGC